MGYRLDHNALIPSWVVKYEKFGLGVKKEEEKNIQRQRQRGERTKNCLGLINQSLTLANIYVMVIWQDYKNIIMHN